MKSVLLALLATLVGAAMVGGGVYGVIQDVSDDDDSGSDSSSSPSNVDTCPSPDQRFSKFNTYDIREQERSATIVISCQDERLDVSFLGTDLPAEKPRTVALWLYNNRKDYELIGSTQQDPDDQRAIISGELPSDSQNYKKIAVTEEKANSDSEDPRKPTKVLLDVEL